MEFKFKDVNEAFTQIVNGIHRGSIPVRTESSRNGPVLQVDEPILVTYTDPCSRVLLNEARDANPFFHLYEAMWMLAGRNDVAPLAYYTPNIRNYSDDGVTFNGAYGYRWRQSLLSDTATEVDRRLDQLDIIVYHLKRDPNSRRAVLQMWNVEDDLLKIGFTCVRCKGTGSEPYNNPNTGVTEYGENALCQNCDACLGSGVTQTSKDVCCNLSVMFSIREERLTVDRFLTAEHVATDGSVATMRPRPAERYLDMTVVNRSNDIIWGMLGANYVHFTFLQEYMAARIGVEVGGYRHFTNNAHIYTENNSGFKPEEWLRDSPTHLPATVRTIPLVRDPVMFERELKEFVDWHNGLHYRSIDDKTDWAEPFFALVGHPMLCAFHHHKHRQYASSLAACSEIVADDWREAATTWITNRRANYLAKDQGDPVS